MADLPTQGASLRDYQEYIGAELTGRGFANETVAQKFMLLIEEVGELAKAARRHADIKISADATNLELIDEFGDVLIMALDLCNKLGVDADLAIRTKETKNKHRVWN